MNQNALIKMVSADDAAEIAKREFQTLRDSIFRVVPDGCFLTGWHVLDLRMIFMLSPAMVDRGLVSSKDICSLCSANGCPHNAVSHKVVRVIKIKVLGQVFNKK